jgi:chromosome partitioning protein
MKIIAITNQKGGVGKTTTTVNLAAGLAEKGRRTLVVDLDPQGNATGVLGLRDSETPGLYDALVGGANCGDLIQPTRLENLSAITADLDLAGAEVEVAKMEDHLSQLRNALEPLRQNQSFDFCLLDCPPSLGILMSNALTAADELLIPIQCEYFALEGLGLLMRVADQIRSSGANPSLGISGLVMTMYDARTNLNSAVIADVRSHFQDVVYETVIPRTVRFGEAPSHGLSILEYDANGVGATAYRALAEEFLRRQDAGLQFIPPQSESHS